MRILFRRVRHRPLAANRGPRRLTRPKTTWVSNRARSRERLVCAGEIPGGISSTREPLALRRDHPGGSLPVPYGIRLPRFTTSTMARDARPVATTGSACAPPSPRVSGAARCAVDRFVFGNAFLVRDVVGRLVFNDFVPIRGVVGRVLLGTFLPVCCLVALWSAVTFPRVGKFKCCSAICAKPIHSGSVRRAVSVVQSLALIGSNSHYGPVTPRRVRAPGLHPLQNRHLVGRVPSPGFPVSSIMRIAVLLGSKRAHLRVVGTESRL